ncbi:MAG: 30S ribosomal protein S12 methylthiotransferase RimO [Bacteroidetes bacterium]|nr:30S ribosomal protein S12 methylthiotransferase RimO [Bacteroidota bacterium]
MRVRSAKKNKINIVTLGCSKNLVDSEVMLSQLKSNNMEVTHESQKDDANIVIINTCGFIDMAKDESVQTILNYAQAKSDGKIDKLLVTGCLSERYRNDLTKEIPEVDAWFGTRELPKLLQTLGADYKHELVGERLTTTPFHYAYLKISEGCDRPCSFCAIPLMRGKHVSKPIEFIAEEAKNLVNNGLKELILIAQDSTYYGLDLYGERRLGALLDALAQVRGIEWLRLHYVFPSQFPMDLLDIIAKHQNICKYIDIPIQHISDTVLKTMRRGITKHRTIELLNTIREKLPDATIRTTLIVGHPGETEKEFEELCEFVSEFRFDRLGVFAYSHEEGTHSYTLEDSVSQEEKERRVATIMEIQSKISEEKNLNKVGKTFKVLIDRKEGNWFVGRTEGDSPDVDNEVLFDATQYFLRQGDFVNAEILSASEYDLIAKPL